MWIYIWSCTVSNTKQKGVQIQFKLKGALLMLLNYIVFSEIKFVRKFSCIYEQNGIGNNSNSLCKKQIYKRLLIYYLNKTTLQYSMDTIAIINVFITHRYTMSLLLRHSRKLYLFRKHQCPATYSLSVKSPSAK